MASFTTLKTFFQGTQRIGFQGALRAARYTVIFNAMNRRYGQKPPRGKFRTLGSVTAVEKQAQRMVIHAENGYMELYFVAPEIVRVRVRPDPDFKPPFSYAVDKIDWPQPSVLVQDGPEVFTAQTDHLVCRLRKDGCRLSFETPQGRVFCEDADGGVAWRSQEVRWTRAYPPTEHSYGLGARAMPLNLRGRRLALWNSDPLPGFKTGDDPVYTSIPFYVGTQPELAFGILWDNPARGYVDLGAHTTNEMTFFAEADELRFYLIADQNVSAVLRLYAALTGHMPLPPMWALGYHQSRWGYDSEGVFRRLAEEFRQRRLPCDVLYFDIDYMDGYRSFTWDRDKFPLLPGLLADLEEQGFKSVAIIDPGIKVDDGYAIYEDGLRQDVFLKYPNDKPVAGPVWPGTCHFPDFTSARGRAWWAGHIPVLLQAGFAGLWNDMNEPTVITAQRGTTLADTVKHDWDGLGQTHVAGGHNVYGTLMARATREAIQKERPDKRPFVMTRAAYAGAQRYTSTWTGDNAATWEHLRLSISMVLHSGLSGMAFTGPDVGGFAGEPDGELFTRWMQLGSMLPYFRVHTMAGTAPQEPWRYGDRCETIIRHYLELRYQLLPYIYSVFAQCSQEGTPIARPLFMADPADSNLRDRDDAFMLGDSILVAPVLEPGATRREVRLPKGVWYEFDTGKLIDGAQTITAVAPLERMPIYVRAGKVLPMWPLMQYVGEKPLEESRLRVYAGSGDTTFYEDAGEGLAYQHGAYRWSYFTCKFLPSGQFAIEWRRAGQYQPPYQRIRVEVVGISGEPESVMLDGQAAPIWYYEDGIVEFIVKPFGEARIVGRSHTASHAQTLSRTPR